MEQRAIIRNGSTAIVDPKTRTLKRHIGPLDDVSHAVTNSWGVLIVHEDGQCTLYRIDTGQRLSRIARSDVINADLSESTATMTFEDGTWKSVDIRKFRDSRDRLYAKMVPLLRNVAGQ